MKKSIKSKRQANDQVNRSSSFLQSILDALSAHVAVVDDQGCIVGINEAWRHFAELNGMSWDDWGIGSNYIETCEKAVGPCSEEAGDVAQGIRLVLSGKIKAYRTEYPCHSPDEKRWFQVRVTSFEDREGMKVVAAHESVTELKVAMERIRVSEELFRAVFESAQDLIAVKDRDFVYTKINPAFEKLVGLPVREVLGRRAEDIFGEEAGRHIRELDTRVLAGQIVEEEFTRPVNGIPMTFHDTRVPLLNAEGRTIGICVVSKDVTHWRRASRGQDSVEGEKYVSLAMRETINKARRAAGTDGTVLLVGESGCGKDHLARWIHENSRRSSGPFFAINCAAISKELAESELFGHEAGSFTGARTRKKGLFELAEGGTLLLNEIGELPLPIQAKLLTFLDSKSFLRVGGERHIRIDSRILAATHRNLEIEIAQGRFMEALFYRLNVFMIRVPPLRERTEDIPLLMENILQALITDLQLQKPPEVDDFFLRQLKGYHWPGNVRELRNLLERSLIVFDEGPLRLDIPAYSLSKTSSLDIHFEDGRSLDDVIADATTFVITEALRKSGNNAREAAKKIGVSRDALYRHLKKLGINPPQRPRTP